MVIWIRASRGTEEDRMFCAELEPVSELRGAVRDGKVFGLGASNMKSGVAAFMVAGKALKIVASN